MKIAIPTMDGASISAHFGKSKGFLVFEFEGGAIRHCELRANGQHRDHDHDHGCQGHDANREAIHDPMQTHGHHHDHRGFAELLGDCQAVIVRGMGSGAAQAMRAAGIRVCLIQDDCSPEEAVTAFASGKLMAQEGAFCACHGQ